MFKFFVFIVSVFIFGLAQTWATAIIFWYKSIPVDLNVILRDGGIFFFSTSLVYSSYFSFFTQNSKKFDNYDKAITILAMLVVTSLALIGYTIEFSEAIQNKRNIEFSDNFINGQMICFIVSGTYAFYSAACQGSFKKNGYVSI